MNVDYKPLEDVQPGPQISSIKGLETLLVRGFTPGVLAQWGIIWDEDQRAILIPVHRADGRYLSPIWRSVGGDGPKYMHPAGFPRREVLFGAHTPLTQAANKVVLVEGPLDAVWVQAAGCAAIALLGSSLSKQQLEGLTALGKRNVTLCFDNDPAGNSAAHTIYPMLQQQGMWVRRVYLPAGKNDIQEVPLERVKGVIDKAELAVNGTGFFHSTLRRFQHAPMHRAEGSSAYRY